MFKRGKKNSCMERPHALVLSFQGPLALPHSTRPVRAGRQKTVHPGSLTLLPPHWLFVGIGRKEPISNNMKSSINGTLEYGVEQNLPETESHRFYKLDGLWRFLLSFP